VYTILAPTSSAPYPILPGLVKNFKDGEGFFAVGPGLLTMGHTFQEMRAGFFKALSYLTALFQTAL